MYNTTNVNLTDKTNEGKEVSIVVYHTVGDKSFGNRNLVQEVKTGPLESVDTFLNDLAYNQHQGRNEPIEIYINGFRLRVTSVENLAVY